MANRGTHSQGRNIGFAILRSVALAGMTACLVAQAGEVEVLHWWTSGGEARSIASLKTMMAEQGHQWKDVALNTGGGETADALLHQRFKEGRSPTAALVKSSQIPNWGKLNALANLDDVAAQQNWDVQLPAVVANRMKYNGHYVAVPINVHRANWLWINKDALKRVGGRRPSNYDEFFATADRLKAAGIIPVAVGGQPWQVFNIFDSVALGVGGADFYRKAFMNLDESALKSETMERVLHTFRRIKSYTDPASPGRDWNVTTAMVMRGEAAMQFMGDWAKAEFLAAGKVPEKDFLCAATPGTERAYTFVIDSFVMFKQSTPESIAAQKSLALTMMSGPFQEIFNKAKGSIPPGTSVDKGKFDFCGQESSAYFVVTGMTKSLFPAISGGAQPDAVEDKLRDAVAAFWERDNVSASQTMALFAQVAKKQ